MQRGTQNAGQASTSESQSVNDVQLQMRAAPLHGDRQLFPGTNQLAEIFLGNGRAGSDVDAAAKDAAILASLCLQHSVVLTTVRKALLRDPRGVASSPLGAALDILARERGLP
jgi:hypothetical protein